VEIPDGEAFYVHALRSNTTLGSLEQVHETGLRKWHRSEMAAILKGSAMRRSRTPQKLLNLQRRAFLFPTDEAGPRPG
jgi:uncharacterized protein (DUF885 family)